MKTAENKSTEKARKRYKRIAPVYDLMEGLAERSRYNDWRRLVWSKVEGQNVLEVGVGTGKNFPYYPTGVEITAVDFSEKMLRRARERARRERVKVNLMQMDAQAMEFGGSIFDR